MPDADDSTLSGILVYAVFLPGTVLIGPLEAVLGLVLYWLVGASDGQTSDRS